MTALDIKIIQKSERDTKDIRLRMLVKNQIRRPEKNGWSKIRIDVLLILFLGMLSNVDG